MSKPKFHFLIHLPAYIRRFGPALLFATERYESFNSVFRSSSVHSNHLAPSRDIAVTFSQLDRVKHITLGGWWYDESSRQYVRASPHVSNYLLHYPRYSTLVGLHLPSTKEIGIYLFVSFLVLKCFRNNDYGNQTSQLWEAHANNAIIQ